MLVHPCIDESLENEMKYILLAILLSIATPAFAQYGGPPMWDRNYQDWGPDERRQRLPEPRRYGPQFEPCIYRGDCRGPKYQERIPMGPPRMPPYPDRY